MRADTFKFTIPPARIAQVPAERRDASRLMVVRRGAGVIEHHAFTDLPGLLNAGDLLLVNDTRVKPCRLHMTRAKTGGHVELFVIRRLPGDAPAALATDTSACYETITGSGGRLDTGETLTLPGATATLLERDAFGPGHWLVRLHTATDPDDYLRSQARMPLPPYIRRERGHDPHADIDRQRYQTVFAAQDGAVAAPTAGLHFTPEVLAACASRGINRSALTLHVGPGTFRPLKAATLQEHDMHAEEFQVPQPAVQAVHETRMRGGRVVVVGTTACRTAETVADERGLLRESNGTTRLFIYPPWRFRCTDALLTNFHLPESTLIFLVAAWLGIDLTRQAYESALAGEYRFFSYGDAMLCLP
ncbi:MAG: tRNA preQ1(34) S-adenosylmethionine ribosyltransferase-isomerase QueA [Planctomycetes bacterium]|nr:tRNA preQ1(34) S-adenosylmethionine ribosyltransferase-isomerase QueA [Planctomycetota bacterium]MCW8136601.1 tRNA preQ1(34) S-adenosylmethionine ribosyltransferase-isomerase QueA [Planctomycetota bacterium]